VKKPWSRFAILVVLLIGVSTLTAGAQTVVRVFVDGRAIGLNPPAVILGARVIVPLRGTFEAMGATVSYLAPRTILVVRGSRAIELEIGRPVARVNDTQVLLDTPPITLAGYTRVPLRFVSEALGVRVTVSVPVVGVPIGSTEASVLPFIGLFSANVTYPGLFRGLPLSITVVAIDSTGTESEPVTVLVRQG